MAEGRAYMCLMWSAMNCLLWQLFIHAKMAPMYVFHTPSNQLSALVAAALLL